MFINFIKEKLGIGKIVYEVSDEDKNTIFEHTDTKLGLWANYVIISLIILSVLIVGAYTIPGFEQKYGSQIFFIDFFISSIFLIEYVYRWSNSGHKTNFPFRLMNLLDLLSFLPFFILIIIYGPGGYAIFALFRIFRVFRIFELVVRIPIIKKIGSGINKHKIEYLTAIFVILIILVLFSTLVYLFEQKGGNAVAFTSIPETFWWAIVTMSTTGYGNIIPLSLAGKIIASILMILGPILMTILSTITVIIFLESTKMISIDIEKKQCEKCGSKNDNDAHFCKKCGEKI
ncbi:MAG: ion transporter [Candidatus Gracilibacteria bacterium]